MTATDYAIFITTIVVCTALCYAAAKLDEIAAEAKSGELGISRQEGQNRESPHGQRGFASTSADLTPKKGTHGEGQNSAAALHSWSIGKKESIGGGDR